MSDETKAKQNTTVSTSKPARRHGRSYL